MSGWRRLADEIEAATLDLESHLAWTRFVRLLERELRYRPDQPRAPAGTPEGGQWVDDRVHVAAVRCQGLPGGGGCQNGGTFGSSAMFLIEGRRLC